MKKLMGKVVGKCDELACRAYVFGKMELRRFKTEKDGLGTVEMIALTVVVVCAVVGVASVLSPGLKGMFSALIKKIEDLIGVMPTSV